MFDSPHPSDDTFDIPVCATCPWELHGPDYGRQTCRKCEACLFKWLVEVGELWAQLPSSAHKPVGEREPGRRMSVYPGIPGNAAVINLTAGGDKTPLGRLRPVEDDWRKSRGLPVQGWRGSVAQTMPLVLKFLRDHLPWACGAHPNPRLVDGGPLLPDVQILHDELPQIIGELKQAVNAERRPLTILSRCLAPYVHGFDCEGQVRTGVSLEPVYCPVCGTLWDRETYLRYAQEQQFGAAA